MKMKLGTLNAKTAKEKKIRLSLLKDYVQLKMNIWKMEWKIEIVNLFCI